MEKILKKFKLSIIDDSIDKENGYDRFIEGVLFPGKYLRESKIHLNDFLLDNNGIIEQDGSDLFIKVYSNKHYTFCTAYKDFNEKRDEFDVYVFDLKFKNNKMDPTYKVGFGSYNERERVNICPEAKMYPLPTGDREPADKDFLQSFQQTKDTKSRYLAGLSFLMNTSLDKKPKLIYSAATENKDILNALKLFYERLKDIIIVDSNFQDEEQKSGVYNFIDFYIYTRQIEIINRQRLDTINELKKIVHELEKEDVNNEVDKLLIPDDGNPETEDANRWSLRTLFPRQINSIEDGVENWEIFKQQVLEILQNDFRKLVWWILFNHGNLENDTKIKKLNVFKNRFEALREMDFSETTDISKKSESYKQYKISSFPCFTDKNESGNELSENDFAKDKINSKLSNLRKEISDKWIEYIKDNPEIKEYTGIIENISKSTIKSDEVVSISCGNDLIKELAKYGIHIFDIAFVYQIASSNKSKCGAKNVYLKTAYHDKKIELFFIYDSKEDWIKNNSNRDKSLESVKIIIDKSRKNQKLQLIEKGMGEIFTLAVKRYKGIFEFIVGDRRLVCNDKEALPDDNNIGTNNVYYKITINGKFNGDGELEYE